jgi:peptide deformylase
MHIWTIDKKEELKLLRKTCAPFDFSKYGKEEIRTLLRAMKEMMRAADGLGLSANQIGLDISVFVARVDGKFYEIFNPRITKISPEQIEFEEGCLSIPSSFGVVDRPEKIVLNGQDKNGKPVKIKAWGLLSRVFQHEVDHLNGKLFIDKARKVQKIELQK